jgi:hypothetical protein
LAETGLKPCSQDVFFFYFGLVISLAPVVLGLEFDPPVFYTGIALLAAASFSLCRRNAFFASSNPMLSLFFFYFGLVVSLTPVVLGLKFNPPVFYAGIALLAAASLSLCRRNAFFASFNPMLSLLNAKWFYRLYLLCSVFWVAVVILKYFSLNYHTFDTGMYSQLLAGFARSNQFYNTFTNRHGLADHFCPNLMLLYPFFRLYPTCFWLIGLKLLAFLSCPLLLLHLGRKAIGADSRLIYAGPMLFLVNSYVANTMAFEFQPSSLALPFILLAFIFALDGRPILTLLTMLFLLGFKEHLPLVWASIAVFCYTEKKRVFPALFALILGAAFGFVLNYSAIPFFNLGEPSPHDSLIQAGVLIWPKVKMLILALACVGFLPLLAPRTVLFILPAFGAALLSNAPVMQTFDFHYQDVPLVVLFVGVIVGLAAYARGESWLNRQTNKRQETFFAVGLAALCVCTTHSVPTFIVENIPSRDRLELLSEARQYAKLAPQDVDVWVVEPLSVLFLGHPKLRSLDRHKQGPSQAAESGELPKTWPLHVVVITDNADTSGLPPERYEEARKGLEAGLLTGKYTLKEGFHKLKVYIH